MNGFDLTPGLEMRNRVQRVYGGFKAHVNCVFKVVRFETKKLRVAKKIEMVQCCIMSDEKSGCEFFVPFGSLKCFMYNYCSTIHSSQGKTYNDVPVSIFDFDSFMCKPVDKYTAISRTNNLENVQIYTGTNFKIDLVKLEEKIQSRISSHMEVDTKAGRVYAEGEYIDTQWVMDRLMDSQICPCCGEDFSLINSNRSHNDFSVERIDDSLAHTKENCIIYCRNCNNSRIKIFSDDNEEKENGE
jgi:hypothetical protein